MTVLTIKDKIRDAVIIVNGLRRRLLGRNQGRRVIALHEIPDPEWFREKMKWLKDQFDILPMGKLLSSSCQDKNQVTLTFDDGFCSYYEWGLPILEELQLPAVFFICSGFIGLDESRAKEFVNKRLRRSRPLRPLTRQQLSDIAKHPLFEIGGHTTNHIDLGKIDDQSVLQSEIEDDQKRLEDWTGTDVQWFAYPFGSKNNLSHQAQSFLKQSSYKAAFTIIPSFIEKATDPYQIGRDSLSLDASSTLWSAWLSGGYDFRCLF